MVTSPQRPSLGHSSKLGSSCYTHPELPYPSWNSLIIWMFRNCICNIIQFWNCISAWPLRQLWCSKFHKDSDNVILFPIEYSYPDIDSHKINTIIGLNEPWTSSTFCPPTHKTTHITWLKGENAHHPPPLQAVGHSVPSSPARLTHPPALCRHPLLQIGRASCRERV